MNKILNIVFYEADKTKEKRAKVFYKNNIVEDIDFDSSLEICLQFAKENNIKTMSEFKSILNKDLIYVKSEKDLIANMEEYKIDKEEIPTKEKIEEEITKQQEEIKEENEEVVEDIEDDYEEIFLTEEQKKDYVEEEIEEDQEVEEIEEDQEVEEIEEDQEVEEKQEEQEEQEEIENYDVEDEKDPIEDDENVIDINDSKELEKNDLLEKKEKQNKEEYKGIKGFFRRIKDKLKKNKLIRRIVLCITALAVGLGIYSCAARKTLEGKMANSNLTSITNTNNQPKSANNKEDVLFIGDNTYYDNYDFDTLIKVTTNDPQKEAMTNNFEMLKSFNGVFANAYEEKGIKPALSFDEVSALQIAYNDYSKEEIKKIFNGSEIKSKDLDNYYKSASLQLMGAYVIETKENPFDASILINDNEGKEFYNKYHKLFMNAKYAKPGQQQDQAVKMFYAEVRKDFPITKEVRTEGIAHADDHNSIESYKLSVTPMIAAAEMMFQNLKIDNTLKDGEIDFINDIGLCNYAKDVFNRVETVLLVSDTNKEEPLYDQYKNSVIKMMTDKKSYVIDDAHRELSKLKVYQLAVNGHFDQVINGDFKCNQTVVSTYTDSQTTYREETSVRELPITDEAKREVDAGISRENQAAKQSGERQAERNRENMQASEDRNAEKVREEVRKDDKDMHEKIDDANENIEKGKSVNERDFGDHNVDFDNDHSDDNGNLNNSVKDITTDGSGAYNGALPDPNETGRKFDAAATGASNATIADQYVEYVAATSAQETETGYQYVK